jgi:hypothetical protein
MAAHKGPASLRPRCIRGGSLDACLPSQCITVLYLKCGQVHTVMAFFGGWGAGGISPLILNLGTQWR